MQSLSERASFSHSGDTRARDTSRVHVRLFVLLFFLSSSSSSPPHCETFVLYWHGEHPSHQCLHASTVPGGARGGDGAGGPFKSHYSDKWHFVRGERTLRCVIDGVQQVVRCGWLKDAHRLNLSCCCCLPNKSKTMMRRALLSQYTALFLLIYFFLCKGWI